MNSYLDDLPLAPDEKAKLQNLAAESPAALLSMMRANRAAFEEYLGARRIDAISALLNEKINRQERRILETPFREDRGFGAIVGKPAPVIKSPDYDIEERDRLFEELQRLEKQDTSSDQVRHKINNLTERLNKLLTVKV